MGDPVGFPRGSLQCQDLLVASGKSAKSHIEKQELTIECSIIFGKYIELIFLFFDHRIEYVFEEFKS